MKVGFTFELFPDLEELKQWLTHMNYQSGIIRAPHELVLHSAVTTLACWTSLFHRESDIPLLNTFCLACCVCSLQVEPCPVLCCICVANDSDTISAESLKFPVQLLVVKTYFLHQWLEQAILFQEGKIWMQAMSLLCDMLPRWLWVMELECSLSFTGGWKVLMCIATVMGRNWGFGCKLKIYMCTYESSQALACVKVLMIVFQMAL